MAKAWCLWLPPFEKGGIEGGFLRQILPRPLLLQSRGEQRKHGVGDFPPFEKGGIEGGFLRQILPRPLLLQRRGEQQRGTHTAPK